MSDPKLHKGAAKTARIPIKIVPQERLRLPSWIRVKSPSPEVMEMKGLLRRQGLHTVCEEAACPNLPECFG
ncbi:MAG: lipoyl synthase, partial [Thiobacillaceae bacterium]